MEPFYEIIFDDNNSTMQIIGISTDDTKLVNNVAEMQKSEMNVRCQTAKIWPKDKLKIPGYNFDETLYDRLLNDYNFLTGKYLKRW